MRLRERELIVVHLAKRTRKTDGLGACPEAFSDAHVPFRASLLPDGGELQAKQMGLKSGERIRLLTCEALAVRPGDGVYAPGGFYIVQSVRRWAAHQELICEARA